MREEEITTEQLQRALRTLAKLVAGKGGEAYVPFFERIEAELAQRERVRDAKERARALLLS
jgi:hypothetical protein